MYKSRCGERDRGTLKEVKIGKSEGTRVRGEAVESRGQDLLATIKEFMIFVLRAMGNH